MARVIIDWQRRRRRYARSALTGSKLNDGVNTTPSLPEMLRVDGRLSPSPLIRPQSTLHTLQQSSSYPASMHYSPTIDAPMIP